MQALINSFFILSSPDALFDFKSFSMSVSSSILNSSSRKVFGLSLSISSGYLFVSLYRFLKKLSHLLPSTCSYLGRVFPFSSPVFFQISHHNIYYEG